VNPSRRLGVFEANLIGGGRVTANVIRLKHYNIRFLSTAMTNPYEPTVLTPRVTVALPVDERTGVCRLAVVSVYGLCNLTLLISVLSRSPSIFALVAFLFAAAPATMWAYIDADIRGYRIRAWQIFVLATVWPLGLFVYLRLTRPKRGVRLWFIHLVSIIGVFVACVVLFFALIIALLLVLAFTVGISIPGPG
jgi:hypothetical protein